MRRTSFSVERLASVVVVVVVVVVVIVVLLLLFFLINLHLSGIPSECQIVWIQIRPDTVSGLIWVQTV